MAAGQAEESRLVADPEIGNPPIARVVAGDFPRIAPLQGKPPAPEVRRPGEPERLTRHGEGFRRIGEGRLVRPDVREPRRVPESPVDVVGHGDGRVPHPRLPDPRPVLQEDEPVLPGPSMREGDE